MELQDWINEWVTLDTNEQKADFDKRFKAWVDSIPESEQEAFKNIFYQSAIKDLDEAKDLVKEINVRKELECVLPFVSLSGIAEKYFNRKRHWLYQKLNGNIVNGKPAKFTQDEIHTLSKALDDIARDIKRVSVSMRTFL
ncbi:MAG: DUF5053 domain-containing protein [Prevotella sp.]|jgi:hypothetical protein|nr:DUF5053 domain-containing protein [Prevotella sp.]